MPWLWALHLRPRRVLVNKWDKRTYYYEEKQNNDKDQKPYTTRIQKSLNKLARNKRSELTNVASVYYSRRHEILIHRITCHIVYICTLHAEERNGQPPVCMFLPSARIMKVRNDGRTTTDLPSGRELIIYMVYVLGMTLNCIRCLVFHLNKIPWRQEGHPAYKT